ncbi:hypothetical protein ABPG73_006405 [Tetrahymena malaccensis]
MDNYQAIYLEECRRYFYIEQYEFKSYDQSSSNKNNNQSYDISNIQVIVNSYNSREKAQVLKNQFHYNQNINDVRSNQFSSSYKIFSSKNMNEFGSCIQGSLKSQSSNQSQESIKKWNYFQEQKGNIKDELSKKYYTLPDNLVEKGGESYIYYDAKKDVIIKIIFTQTQHIDKQKQIFDILKNERKFIKLIDHIKINDNLHIFIHEKCQQNLYQVLLSFDETKFKFTNEKLIKIIFDLIQGLIDLRNKSILHLDIKLSNILVDKNGNYIYCDFGISEIYDQKNQIKVRGYTEPYASQEQKNEQMHNQICFKSDVYSLGMTLIKVLEKFKQLNPQNQIQEFIKNIENIINNKMIQVEIKSRSDCHQIHYLFSEELFKIKNKIDLTFIEQISQEINQYLNLSLKQSEIVDQHDNLKQMLEKRPIDVTFFYLNFQKNNQIESQEFIDITNEIEARKEKPNLLIIYFEYCQVQKNIADKLKEFIQMFKKVQIFFNQNDIMQKDNINVQEYLQESANQLSSNLSLINIQDKESIENIIKNCPNVSQLYLQLSSNSFTKDGLSYLKEAIINSKKLTKLNLSLSFTYITMKGAKKLGEILEKWDNISKLTHLTLNFEFCQVSDEEIENLSLENCQDMKQFELDIRNNYISDYGSNLIGDNIKNFQKITHLNLNLENNSVTREGQKYIVNSIQNCENIKKLKLLFKTFTYEGSSLNECKNQMNQ